MLCAVVEAQQLPVVASIRHFSLEQGLPNKQVIALGQDRQGFMWVGTFNNAYRFDGHRFTPMPPLLRSTQQSVSPDVKFIQPDREGNLWFASNVVSDSRRQGVLKAGAVRPQQVEDAFNLPANARMELIYDFVPSAANWFQYVRTKSGTLWWHTGKGRFRKLYQHPALVGRFGQSLYETSQQTLLVGQPTSLSQANSSSELMELDSTGRIRQRHVLPMHLRPIWKDSTGNIYLQRLLDRNPPEAGTPPLQTFLYRLSPDGKLAPLPIGLDRDLFPRQAHPPFADLSISYDAHHNLFWICGPHVLLAWHEQKGIVFDLSKSGFSMESIQKFLYVFIDRTGAVWVCSTNGVLLLTLETNYFQRYLSQPATGNPTAVRQAIRGMMQLGNQLWVNARETQLVDLKTGKGQFVFQRAPASWTYALDLCPIVRDRDGTLWSGMQGLIRIDPKTYAYTPFALPAADNNCVTIWPDGYATLWVGQQQGISLFDTRRQVVRAFTRYNRFSELARSRVNGFFPDKRIGKVWITSSSGLYLLDTLKGIEARYSAQMAAPYSLPFDHITFVHPDPEQPTVYWLATSGGGLVRWDRRKGGYTSFTQKQGLSDNTLYAIYEDGHQRLWLPSNYGLMSFHRKTHQLQIYHTKDGIADEEFNLISHYRAPDGRLYVGGLNGVTAFYPDQIPTSKSSQAPLLLTQYQKLNTETGQMDNHFAEFREDSQIHLTASDRLFTLGFALLDYRYIGQARLWYRIKGWQDKWVVQDQLELRLNSLPAGSYTIQVRAQTSHGNWASPLLSVPVIVDKPVYLRAWFLLLCTLLLMVGIGVVFRWRNRQLMRDKIHLEAEVARRTAQIEEDKAIIERDKAIIEQQAADLQANVTLKSRFFANVSHELHTPLTLLLGPIQYLSRRVTDESAQQLLSVMNRNTNQLLTLVNDLLDLTRLDNQQAQLVEQPADLALLVRQTVNNFMTQAQYLGVYLYATGLDEAVWMPLDSPKMETVLRNLLANALHYTATGGTIQVQLSKTDKLAEIRVVDTGSGIHADDLPHIFERYFQSKQIDNPVRGGTGIGLALCQEYCTLWGGEIQVRSELGKGSAFTITYPDRRISEHVSVGPAKVIPPPSGELAIPALVRLNTREEMALLATGKSVLVVEDHVDMLLYIQTVLSPHYELLIARNGRQALDLLHQLTPDQLPDLIVSDIMMPEVDGMALVNALRTNTTFVHIPIILLTARVDLETRLQALRLGIADYLTKPFNETELLVRSQHLIERAEEQARLLNQLADEADLLAETTSDQDAVWIDTLQQLIRNNLTNPALTIHFLAETSSLSERQLYRRIRELTGLSPNQFIQEVRLQVAQELIKSQPKSMIKSIGYQVGYQNTSYFIRIYRERFGINPGERSHATASALYPKGPTKKRSAVESPKRM
ncbi:MAG: hypothetical protein BGO59_14815 [Spirosoma sp. 48-14]|nr:MAG: hypothetical protein BGO59_14815 [Spirosoma sp. 48-14]